ncbi:MAG: hypothetical protein E7812_12925 [Phenylobacterium sp.]|nr:MAG: hypothetical protein E7812_12925 [Phenylobacterium sp.]
MGLKLSILGLASVGLLATACATENHQMARVNEATILANAPSVQPTTIAKTGAEANAFGDKWAAANLFERSTDRDKSVRVRFDLATLYAQTGRTAEARDIYASLVRDGEYTEGVQSVDYQNRGARLMRFNISEESARRLTLMDRGVTFAANSTGGAVAAGEFGTPTSAIVGGAPVVEHRISDAEALRRDETGAP